MDDHFEKDPGFKNRQILLEMLKGYRQSRVLIACSELGVFEALAGSSRQEQELADHLHTSLRGLRLLLNAAAALGLLVKQGSSYHNSPMVEAYLAEPGPYYLGNFIRREAAFYRRWDNLTQAIRSGQRPEENIQDEKPAEWVRDFQQGLYDLSRPVAPLIAEALALPEDRPLRLLDIGGGHGGYSLALARQYPNLTATVFELPRVVPITREIIAQEGLEERVTVQEGDFHQDDLGSDYDLVLLFGILPGESPEGRDALIRKVSKAVKPGGSIVLREQLLDPDGTNPPEAALFALQMLLATDTGGVSTTAELEMWLREADFHLLRTLHLPNWTGTVLVIADKRSP